MKPPAAWGGLLRLHSRDIARLQRWLDPALITLLFIALQGLPFRLPGPDRIPAWLWVGLTCLLVLPMGGLYASYRHQNSLARLAGRVLNTWLLVLTVLLLLSFASKTTASFSRIDTSVWALASALILLFNHVGVRLLLRHYRSQGGNSRTLVYVGDPAAAAAFAAELARCPWMGLRLQAWFTPEPGPITPLLPGLPAWSGDLEALPAWLRQHRVDRIVFGHLPEDPQRMEQQLRLFGDTSLPVVYAPPWARPSMRLQVDYVGDQCCIDLWSGEQPLIDLQLKRLFDLLVSALLLLLAAPLLLLIGLAVKLSGPGPVLFQQERYGLDGRRFRIHKFRTMRVLERGDAPGLRQAQRGDPRVTPVGRILRRWSLDELPQLFNVLKGEMSLVGPRPHAVAHNEHYRGLIPAYMQRHAFRPGITGLAQVEGWRGETRNLDAMTNRIDADLRYLRDWSLGLDVWILGRTVFALLSGNAF